MYKRLTICLLLLAALLVPAAGAVQAANLTSGTYTYVINGEEATFPFDPVAFDGDLLLPAELFQRFGITLEGALTRNITLKKRDIEARVTLGSRASMWEGKAAALPAAPLRLNGRLFLPSDLLKPFGIDFRQDDKFLILQDDSSGLPYVQELSEGEFKKLQAGRHFSASPKSSGGISLSAEWTLLNPDLLGAENLGLTYGTRVRLLGLMESYTVVMVRLSNYSVKSGTIDTKGLYLVDQLRNQYDVVNVVDAGNGLINENIAPGATRTGVLLFPKATPLAELFQLYYDVNGEILGLFTNLH